MKRFDRRRKTLPIALGIAMLATLLFAGVASAASPAVLQASDAAIENFYKREQTAYTDQGLRLQTANTISEKAQTWIDALKAKGKDTQALESALAAYKASIASAQADHDTAGLSLNAGAGFDSSGKVTDRRAAIQTVIGTGKPMRQAHLTITQGTLDFRAAIRAARAAK